MLPMKHTAILTNIQNCRNSLNAGRPTDFLERHTVGGAGVSTKVGSLSRLRVMSGLFLCEALLHAKCKGMSQEVRQFMERLEKKRPGERQCLG